MKLEVMDDDDEPARMTDRLASDAAAGPAAAEGHVPSFLRLRHPLELRPHRPAHQPVWDPSRNRRDLERLRRPAPEPLVDARIVAAPDLGAVRVNFRYASFQSMTAAHSEKAGRDQYFEGPHETNGFRLHEIDPFYLDLQYQPIAVVSRTRAGASRRMTLDWAVETQDHRIVFGEDKASDGYFDDPDLTERLDLVEAFLERNGASLVRRVAGDQSTDLKRRVVKDIFDARRTTFDDDAGDRVRALIVRSGGTGTLGNVLTAIGGHPTLALEVARAMMHRRILSMPVSSPPMRDTPVTIPPAASRSALRAFLARHVDSSGES